MGLTPDRDTSNAERMGDVEEVMDAKETADHLEDYAPEDVQKAAQIVYDPEWVKAQKRYLRKLDFIVLPMISTLYFFEYLDRGNIGNAKLYGIANGHDTKSDGLGPGKRPLSSNDFETILMLFYVGLIVCQIPGCIGYRIFSPSKWIAFGVCGWAVASMLQDAAFNLGGELACRVFLGAFEGLFGTGIVYYLSLWYHRTEMGVRVFWFLGPTAFAGAFGGLIAFGIGHIETSVPNWKWLFLIEGLPCFCLGLVCLWWIPDRPLSNSRFSGIDQEIAEARYKSESFDKAGKIQMKHIIWTMKDWKLYAQAAIYFPTACMLATISGFLPTIVSNLGYEKATTANLMTVPPYAVAFALMYLASLSSDHFKERGYHIAALMTLSGIAFALLATLPETQLHGKYACVCIAVAAVYATYPATHAWASNNFANETQRAFGMGMYTALGNFGSIAGSFLFPANEGPQFHKGHFVCMGLSFLTVVFALANKFTLRALNNSRDKKHGKPVPGVTVDVSELGDRNPAFRYIT